MAITFHRMNDSYILVNEVNNYRQIVVLLPGHEFPESVVWDILAEKAGVPTSQAMVPLTTPSRPVNIDMLMRALSTNEGTFNGEYYTMSASFAPETYTIFKYLPQAATEVSSVRDDARMLLSSLSTIFSYQEAQLIADAKALAAGATLGDLLTYFVLSSDLISIPEEQKPAFVKSLNELSPEARASVLRWLTQNIEAALLGGQA